MKSDKRRAAVVAAIGGGVSSAVVSAVMNVPEHHDRSQAGLSGLIAPALLPFGAGSRSSEPFCHSREMRGVDSGPSGVIPACLSQLRSGARSGTERRPA